MQFILLDTGGFALWAAATGMKPVPVTPEGFLDCIVGNLDIEQGCEASLGDVPGFSLEFDELDILGICDMISKGVTSLME